MSYFSIILHITDKLGNTMDLNGNTLATNMSTTKFEKDVCRYVQFFTNRNTALEISFITSRQLNQPINS